MEIFVAQIPVPSRGATVHELTLIGVEIETGETVQKCAEFESDKSAFGFEAPCTGTVKRILARAGDIVDANTPFILIETNDLSQKHLEVADDGSSGVEETAPKSVENKLAQVLTSQKKSIPVVRSSIGLSQPSGSVKWTPKALRIVRDAGFDPDAITDIAATGPGGRVSGDDVQAHIKCNGFGF